MFGKRDLEIRKFWDELTSLGVTRLEIDPKTSTFTFEFNAGAGEMPGEIWSTDPRGSPLLYSKVRDLAVQIATTYHVCRVPVRAS